MYLCVCLCACRKKWSWGMTCIQTLEYLEQWLREYSIRVAVKMALSHSFFHFYSGNKAERNKTKGLQNGIFHPFRNRERKLSLEKIWNVYSWGWAFSPSNDEEGAVGETKILQKDLLSIIFNLSHCIIFLEITKFTSFLVLYCAFSWVCNEQEVRIINDVNTFLS